MKYSLPEIKAAIIKTCKTEGDVNIHRIDDDTWYEDDWEIFVENLQRSESEIDKLFEEEL